MRVFDRYTQAGLSIGAITRELNQRQIPTRTGMGRWERSTVWGVLRNPAYCGRACFGKTERRERQRITRRVRQRGGPPPRQSASHDRPRQEWIEIPVPALISEQTFALAQEQLQKNKQFASRRTIRPTLLQSLLVCQHSLGPLEEENHITNSTTTAVLAPIAGDTFTAPSVRTGRFGKTILTH